MYIAVFTMLHPSLSVKENLTQSYHYFQNLYDSFIPGKHHYNDNISFEGATREISTSRRSSEKTDRASESPSNVDLREDGRVESPFFAIYPDIGAALFPVRYLGNNPVMTGSVRERIIFYSLIAARREPEQTLQRGR